MDGRTKLKRRPWTWGDGALVVMASLGVIWLGIFAYLPMAGITMAFKEGNKATNLFLEMFQSKWTLGNFSMLFKDSVFWQVFWNTVCINLLFLLCGFPMPIIFALLLNEIRKRAFKTTVQTICNFPHFLSWVVFGGIILMLTDPLTGIVNPILEFFRLSSSENPVNLNLAKYFYPKIILASLIKSTGWGSIIYMAAIAGIDPSLYEAAVIDGANRFQRAARITLPSIRPTIIILLLLNISGLLGNSFEQFYVFQTTENLSRTRVLATYMYTLSFTYRNYSTATALSLAEGLVGLALLLSANFIAKKTTGDGIF